jgi:hypothetical protein
MRKYTGFLLVFLTVLLLAGTAQAERGRRPPPTPDIPQSEAVTKLVAEEQPAWGSSPKQVINHYSKAYRSVYGPILAKTRDAILEDRTRRQMNERIQRIEKSLVVFDGQRTGWDSSFLRTQYTHNNSEALVAVRQVRSSDDDPRYVDYFFFINSKLWRRYRAFNQDAFGGIAFEDAAQSFQKHFGPAKEYFNGEEGALDRLAWQDGQTKLEAVDNTRFYGFFSLVFTDIATEGRLAELRTNKSTGDGPDSASKLLGILDQAPEDDQHSDIVEHLTGKRYNTGQPQPPVKADHSKGGNKAQPSKGAGNDSIFDTPSRPSKRTGDPLTDLEI